MHRPLSAERQREVEELLRYLEFFATYVKRAAEGAASIRQAHQDMVAEFGPAKAPQGLKQAVNDTVEMCGHKPIETIAALDEALRTHQTMTFTQVLGRCGATYKKILKRGNIKDEVEYYLVAALLADLAAKTPSNERELLQRLADAYLGEA